MLMFEFQSMKFGPIYAKDIDESKAIVNLTKLKVKEHKFRDKHIRAFGLVFKGMPYTINYLSNNMVSIK